MGQKTSNFVQVIKFAIPTNKDLAKLVNVGQMRLDFYYRINVVSIFIPPFRERKDDISLLVYHFYMLKPVNLKELKSLIDPVCKKLQIS